MTMTKTKSKIETKKSTGFADSGLSLSMAAKVFGDLVIWVCDLSGQRGRLQ